VSNSNKLAFVLALAACGGSKPTTAPTPVKPSVDVEHPNAAPAPPVKEMPPPEPPAATANPKADLIPRTVLFGNPERAGVQVSPDGKYLSWLAPKDGVLNVWVAPVGKLAEAKPVTSDSTRPIYQYMWTFTGKHILYQQDTAGDENFHVFRVDVANGEATDLTPGKGARADIVGLSHKQPTTVLVQINDRKPDAMDLHKIDIVTGKHETLVQNDDGFLGIATDYDLKPRLAAKKLSDGSTQLVIAESKDGKLTWKLWDQIAFEDADTSSIAGFTPDNKAIYFTETRGRDTGALVQIDLATKKSRVIAEDPKADTSGMIMHPTKHTLEAVGFEYDKLRWKVLDKSIKKDLDALDKLAPGAQVRIDSRTLDDKTWIVSTSSEQHPGRYYVWDRKKQKATFLFAVQPELEKQPLVKMWPVEIKSRDGLTLMSYLSLPAASDANNDGKADKPTPMVLYVHGGPWARDSWGFEPIAQLMANRGYAVLSVNYRGSTGFGKKFMNASNLQWSKKMHDDLLDAVQWAVDEKVTSKETVCILGGSYGGYATLVGVTLTPDVFRCGVDLVGPSNLLTFMASIPAYWAPAIALLHSRVGNPGTAEGKALLVAASPLTHVANIKKPLLILQGKNDPRVKEAESEQIVGAMQKARLPVTYALFPDEGHGFARPENNIAFIAITEAFLSAHLGGFYLPSTSDELKASSMQIKVGRSGIPGLPQ
jgi:dipeptidyl aminopeptidase/acylaminoacyl peptidase